MKINKERMENAYRIVMIIIITALVTFSVTSVVLYRTGRIQYIPVSKSDTTGLGSLLSSFKQLLDNKFLYSMDDTEMTEAAIKAYISAAGDEYTVYYTPKEMEDFQTYTNGNYVGIGIYMVADTENNEIIVSSPIKNSPAYLAGIKSGDIISKVDGKTYEASQINEMANSIKGTVGTTVELEILRGNEILKFTIERENVELYPVEGKILENDIGYIELATFDEESSKRFKEAFIDLQKNGIKSLIIDLRDNGGGIVDEAMKIADYILDKDSEMLITRDKSNNEEITKSENEPIINIPIIVLTNNNTASASEMLAGALKDYKKAIVVGKTTYGKGVIQELYSLKDGSGLKITTKEYYTPNRNKIQKIGIEPNYDVDSIENNTIDEQLEKAINLLLNRSQNL